MGETVEYKAIDTSCIDNEPGELAERAPQLIDIDETKKRKKKKVKLHLSLRRCSRNSLVCYLDASAKFQHMQGADRDAVCSLSVYLFQRTFSA